MEEESVSGRWVLMCWALAAAFFAVSSFYAVYDNLWAWLVWLTLFFIWSAVAIHNTIKYFRRRV